MWGATNITVILHHEVFISIHAPRVGRDVKRGGGHVVQGGNFNPRAPCGARRGKRADDGGIDCISIHAPRVGRDEVVLLIYSICVIFQSTRPVWGATMSTESLRKRTKNFNPRAPCGARRLCRHQLQPRNAISIHAPRVGRDAWATRVNFNCSIFQSTRPVWGATANLTILPRQICTKGTKEFLLVRKTHEKKGKIKQKLAYIHAFSAFLGCEGSGTFCALVLRTQYR